MGMGQGSGVGLNPYAPPAGDIEFVPAPVSAQSGVASRNLYSAHQIGWAAYLGAFFAGVLLMYLNYRALGDRRAARHTLWWGLSATAIMQVTMAFMFDDGFARIGFAGLCMQFYGFCMVVQGPSFARHVAAGGKRASHWAVAGIIVLCSIAGAGLYLIASEPTRRELFAPY
jgi:hypothetical protein